MPRYALPQKGDEVLTTVGDNVFIGMDMKTPDPAAMKQGTYREGYNCRTENGGLVTRRGVSYPGSFNYVQYSRIFGVGMHSDPNGLEWVLIATSGGVWFIRDGEAPKFLPFDFKLENPVQIIQAFDKLFLFRGANDPPLVWNGDFAVYWEPLPPPTGGRSTIPNADTAELYANRLLVPYGRDRVAVSDIGSYSEYDWAFNDFQVNTGEADKLVRVFPWIKNSVLMFKEHSIFLVSNVYGDLTKTTLEQISKNRGLAGPKALVEAGNDIYFMDWGGVYQIAQIFENSPQVQALPISDMIRPVMDSINWNAGAGIRANVRRERIYFAVPLKNAIRNNALLIYNCILQSWESIDTFEDPDFRIDDLIRAGHNQERRLFAIDRNKALILMLEAGKTDLMGPDETFERQIQFDVTTRGYLGPGPRSNFQRLQLDVAQWNPKLTISAYVDGTNAKTLAVDVLADRSKYTIWGKPRWDSQNFNDDHANAYREDYSVLLPFQLGYNGIEIEREQELSHRYRVQMFGRYCQLRVTNKQGFLGLRSVLFEGFEDQRQERGQI